MKAENILISYLVQKIQLYKKYFPKIEFSKFFVTIVMRKNFLDHKFFQENIIQPP